MLLMKLTHALDKHAHQEEMVVYPALREADETVDADHLESEHGYIKTFIYQLNEMGPEASNSLETVREFRALVVEHAHMEEEQVFPRFKQTMDEEQNDRITSLVNRDGFWMALADQASFGGSCTDRSTLPSPADSLDPRGQLAVERIVSATRIAPLRRIRAARRSATARCRRAHRPALRQALGGRAVGHAHGHLQPRPLGEVGERLEALDRHPRRLVADSPIELDPRAGRMRPL